MTEKEPTIDTPSRFPPCPSQFSPRGKHCLSAWSSELCNLGGVEVYVLVRTCYLCGKKVEGT